MTIMEFQAEHIEWAARLLAYWVETTDPEKLNWKPAPLPESAERTILEQVEECVAVNRRVAAGLRGAEPSATSAPLTTAADACAAIRASATELAQVVSGLSDADLTREFALSTGPLLGQFCVTIPASHMLYHGGAVNYIQTLYGDREFHFPA